MLYFFINLGCQKESQLSNEEKEERKKERLGKLLPKKKNWKLWQWVFACNRFFELLVYSFLSNKKEFSNRLGILGIALDMYCSACMNTNDTTRIVSKVGEHFAIRSSTANLSLAKIILVNIQKDTKKPPSAAAATFEELSKKDRWTRKYHLQRQTHLTWKKRDSGYSFFFSLSLTHTLSLSLLFSLWDFDKNLESLFKAKVKKEDSQKLFFSR